MKIFVYGTLKRGHGNFARFLSDAEFVGEGRTYDAEFDMTCVGFPYAWQGGKNKICGEVFDVNCQILQRLDRLEGEGYHYDRRLKLIEMADGAVEMCMMYVARRHRLDSMRPGKPINPVNGELTWTR